MSAERSVVLCTAGFDHTIRFWEAPTGLCHRSLAFADSQVNRLEITPDKEYLAAAGNPHIRLFDIHSSNPSPLTSFDGHTSNVTSIGFQRERKWMFSGSEDGSIKIWDIRVQNYQRDYSTTSGASITSVVLHPNQGELISSDEEGNIRVWDLTANACLYEFSPDGKVPIRSLAIASDASLLLSANNKGIVYSWKLTRNSHQHAPLLPSFDPSHRLEAHNTYILKLLLSPDTHTLATASADRTLRLWHTPAANANLSSSNHSSSAAASSAPSASSSSSSSAAAAAGAGASGVSSNPHSNQAHHSGQYSSNSSIEAGKTNGASAVNGLENGNGIEGNFTLERTLTGHSGWVWDCSFSADSAYLVSGSSDRLAKLWDCKSGEVILEYKGHSKAITAVALNDSS